MSIPTRTAAALVAASLLPAVTLASSGSAWEDMRADVSKKCLAAAGSIEAPKVVVDPFGSETFGLALISGKPKGAEGMVTHICVYDKRTKAVELGGELTDEMLTGAE